MNKWIGFIALIVLGGVLSACDKDAAHSGAEQSHGSEPEVEKGVHRGRLLKDKDFVIELSIFETGVPPEFRVWVTQAGKPVKPQDVQLRITLSRLGGREDVINFKPQADFLRGDSVIHEPHSFEVTIEARYEGREHQWHYENFEGRTQIEAEVAQALEIASEIAGPQTLVQTLSVYGTLISDPEKVSHLAARFDGVIKRVHVSLGERVKKGQALLVVESNESLKQYTIKAPISGVISHRDANPGEQTASRTLLTILDNSTLWATLSVFPEHRQDVKLGAGVRIWPLGIDKPIDALIQQIDPSLREPQTSIARVALANPDGALIAGLSVSAQIERARYTVPLAVKKTGLQTFRDFTVVYAKVGTHYEVRMLELGRQAGEWVEVLGGLEVGTEYVAKNSYIIKADIEKSGASHDH